jgi:hypothetical protein
VLVRRRLITEGLVAELAYIGLQAVVPDHTENMLS